MADAIEFHEYKFEAFRDQVRNSQDNIKFLNDLRQRGLSDPNYADMALRMERTVQLDNENRRKFIETIVKNLISARKEEDMSSWKASSDMENSVRQRQVEQCATEFYEFCESNGFGELCRNAGLNLSQPQSANQPAEMSAPTIPSPPVQTPPVPTSKGNWYYHNNKGEKIGPISVSALKALVQQGLIGRETVIVNHTGRSSKAGEVRGLEFPERMQLSDVLKKYPMEDTNINANGILGTRLHQAAERNDVEALVVLIKAGADIAVRNNFGSTPLHTAAMKDATESIGVLVKAGANINAGNETGCTPLHIAAMTNAINAIIALVNAGANVNATSVFARTPLHEAAYDNHVDAIVALIEAGANVEMKDDSGNTPLQMAVLHEKKEAISALTAAKVGNASPFSIPIAQSANSSPFSLPIAATQPANANPFTVAAPAVNPQEAAFLYRCPEIDLSVIPEARRMEFMRQYESIRPQMEGNNILVYLTDDEIINGLTPNGYAVERLQYANLNGIQAIRCRIHDGGPALYQQILANCADSIVANYRQSSSGFGFLGFASIVAAVIGLFTFAIRLGAYLGDPDA